MRQFNLTAYGKCRRCGAKVPIQFLSNGLCRACKRELEYLKESE